MDRQALLDNFVKRVGNKGRSEVIDQDTNDLACQYVPNNGHPGCAIGCQPCFDDPRLREILKGYEGRLIYYVLEKQSEIKDALAVQTQEEEDFLCFLQSLNDNIANWEGKQLKQTSVDRFARRHDLVSPRVPTV